MSFSEIVRRCTEEKSLKCVDFKNNKSLFNQETVKKQKANGKKKGEAEGAVILRVLL